MRFREFILAAEEYIQSLGWTRYGHNGSWPVYRKLGSVGSLPLPAAITQRLLADNAFQPSVEAYLVQHGWQRLTPAVSTGLPLYKHPTKDQPHLLTKALIEQLKISRLDRTSTPPSGTEVHRNTPVVETEVGPEAKMPWAVTGCELEYSVTNLSESVLQAALLLPEGWRGDLAGKAVVTDGHMFIRFRVNHWPDRAECLTVLNALTEIGAFCTPTNV